jgi:2-desacetyl-2-hydroxyethyl bacteriochlorophyllide A dehydrogenase
MPSLASPPDRDLRLSVVYKGPDRIVAERIPIPTIPGPSRRVELRAAGICGSDVRYLEGHNPWSLQTLGREIPPPPSMVLGHEICGYDRDRGSRVAILAFKSCGECPECLSGAENLCGRMQHFGHSAGWPEMEYYPGGMAEEFEIWDGFAHEIPVAISDEAATFLDGLAVALHASRLGGVHVGSRVGVIGLGPIGMLIAQAAQINGARRVVASDIYQLPIELGKAIGIEECVDGSASSSALGPGPRASLDVIFETTGEPRSIADAVTFLAPGGRLVLMAAHADALGFPATSLSGERSIISSANNTYGDFHAAIDLLASGQIRVEPLVTHRFRLARAVQAFEVMRNKRQERAYKVILVP